jgi:transposase
MDVDALTAEIGKLKAELAAIKKIYEKLALEYERLRRQTIGPKRDRVSKAQLSMLDILEGMTALQKTGDVDEAAALLERVRAETGETQEQDPEKKKKEEKPEKKKKKKPHGRRKETIVDEEVTIEPAERLAPGGELLELIGEDTHVVLEKRRAHVVRLKIRYPKYKKPESPLDDPQRADDVDAPAVEIVRAPPVPSATPKGLLGPLLLASVIVAKYGDHIPLHRQERMFARDGVKLARSTMWDSISTVTPLLERIVQAMWDDARRRAPWFATDATGILVRAPEKCRRDSFFVVCAARMHVLFKHVTGNADGSDVATLLAGFPRGTPMISDASTVFHELYRRSGYVEVACWAHARRMFFDVLTTADRAAAVTAIGLIGLLYEAHDAAKDGDGVVDGVRRKELALPILNALDRFAEEERAHINPESRLAKALNYLDNQREGLRRFLDDGRLRLDNNLSELELRREVVGRKNWLFCGSESGVVVNETCVSLIASCALHDVDPLAYLHEVLLLLPTWPAEEMIELAPLRWGATRQRDDVVATLAERSLLDRSRPVAEE